ncbi:MAG: AraC family transcriptional regulator [Pseudomonadota bacterium]
MFNVQSEIEIKTLGQLAQATDWRLKLAHDRPAPLLIWITRGQGRVLLDGQRRGVGAHNALFVPSGALFALDLARHSIGHALVLPQNTDLLFPSHAHHLRIRDVGSQAELTHEMEATQREDLSGRALRHDALEAHAALISVWLRRQLALEEHLPDQPDAAGRISFGFCELLPERYRSGDALAVYAKCLGVTATHLTRAVKAATGRTASELLAERLLHEARRLLKETSEPAQSIARYLGFTSPAYFSRFMHQHAGAPPSKLRN